MVGFSLVSRPPLFFFFVLRFAFSIIHGSGRVQKKKKTGKAWSHSSHEWTQGGCREEGPIFKYVTNKLESEFLTGEDK